MPLTDDEVKDVRCLSVNDVIGLMKKIDSEKMFDGEIGKTELHLTKLAQRISEQQLVKY